MTHLNTLVTYVGKAIPAVTGMVGEIVAKSKFEETPLVTIYFKEIDKKFTVKAINVEPV